MSAVWRDHPSNPLWVPGLEQTREQMAERLRGLQQQEPERHTADTSGEQSGHDGTLDHGEHDGDDAHDEGDEECEVCAVHVAVCDVSKNHGVVLPFRPRRQT